MRRYPDWRERLHAYIESRHQAAFSWGQHNGAIFAAGAVLAMTDRWLYPESLKAVVPEADQQAEVSARALLRALEAQALRAGRELAERKQRLKAARSWLFQLPTAELPILAEEVEQQQTLVDDLHAEIGQQTLAVVDHARRVMEPLLKAVAAEGGLEALVTKRLGDPLPGILLAREGDVLMAEVNTGGMCLGICTGSHGYFVADEGLSKIRLLHCVKAWRVPVTAHEWLNRRAGHEEWHRGAYLKDAHRARPQGDTLGN